MIGMAFVVVLLVGIAIGNETKRMQTASHNVTAALSVLSGVLPTVR
jgi:hypothetical protein